MAYKDMREWMDKLDEEGELKRIKAEVNWDREIGAILIKILEGQGPALLFENYLITSRIIKRPVAENLP